MAKLIAKTLDDTKVDGCVLEIWSQLGGQAKAETTHAIRAIAEEVSQLFSIRPISRSSGVP